MHYLPNEARAEAESAIVDARAASASNRAALLDESRRADAAETSAAAAKVAAARDAREIGYAFEELSLDYEARLRHLEALLAEERVAHAEELRKSVEASAAAQAEARRCVEDAQRRCEAAVAAAEARAAAAECEADGERRRAQREVAETKAQCATRVEEIRRDAEHRLSARGDRNRVLLDQAKAAVLARRCHIDKQCPTFTTYTLP